MQVKLDYLIVLLYHLKQEETKIKSLPAVFQATLRMSKLDIPNRI